MQSKVRPSIVVGTFLALVMCANAARYEDLTVGKITVENTAVLESSLTVQGVTSVSNLTVTGTTTQPLAAAKILVGNAAGSAAAQTVSGDITLATNGAVAIASGVIVNDDVNASAAIASSKLATDVVRAGDTTPNQLIQSGTLNVADVTAQTNTFTVAYKSGTTPIVIATYATTAADVQPVFITSVVSNKFVATIAATNMPINWIAIGQKP